MDECCLLVEFGRSVDRKVNDRVHALADHLLQHMPAGVVDIVPAFCVLAVHYRPQDMAFGKNLPSPYENLRDHIEALLSSGVVAGERSSRRIDIPVCYGGQHGPDLAEVAVRCGLSRQQVIDRHLCSEHLVHMLGFAPGFPYIGGLDTSLMLPRRATPRTRVPAGSVAIANGQTVIYSTASPGGWNLIGQTPLSLFDPHREPPCLLMPGDRLRFVPINADDFAVTAGQQP